MLDMLSCVMVTSADRALRISDAVIKQTPSPISNRTALSACGVS